MRRVWTVAVAASLVGLGGLVAAVYYYQSGQKRPENLSPEEIVAAWENAGFVAGWMATDESGYPRFRRGNREYANHHGSNNWKKEGEVPAFGMTWSDELGSIHVLNARTLGRLPQPQRGFGLYLSGNQVSDRGGTRVTDDGLKGLAGHGDRIKPSLSSRLQ
jgi:hypothetical protein